jgi:hypothetical protein
MKNIQMLEKRVSISIIEDEDQKRASILNASNFLAEIIKEEVAKEMQTTQKEAA